MARTSKKAQHQQERMAQLKRAFQVVKTGVCPTCGTKLYRNSALAGWFQCGRFGAVGFQKEAGPHCDFQIFYDPTQYSAALETMALESLATVTDVLGRTRESDKIYPDGSINCPFCWSAWFPSQRYCNNPACTAYNPQYMTREVAQLMVDREQARKDEEAQRQRDHVSAMERIHNYNSQRNKWEQAQVEEARRRGACINRKCLFSSSGVKFIKHRGQCPRERGR